MKAIYLSFFLAITFFPVLVQSPERRFYSSFRPEGLDFYIVNEDAEEYAKFIYHKGIYGGPVSYISGWKKRIVLVSAIMGIATFLKLPFFPMLSEAQFTPRIIIITNNIKIHLLFVYMVICPSLLGQKDLYLPWSIGKLMKTEPEAKTAAFLKIIGKIKPLMILKPLLIRRAGY